MTQTLNPNDTGEIVNHTQLDQARTEIIDLDHTHPSLTSRRVLGSAT